MRWVPLFARTLVIRSYILCNLHSTNSTRGSMVFFSAVEIIPAIRLETSRMRKTAIIKKVLSKNCGIYFQYILWCIPYNSVMMRRMMIYKNYGHVHWMKFEMLKSHNSSSSYGQEGRIRNGITFYTPFTTHTFPCNLRIFHICYLFVFFVSSS